MNMISSKDKNYKNWLEALKVQIIPSQEGSWEDGIIEQLSKDLIAALPGIQHFSSANLLFIGSGLLFYNVKVSKSAGLLPENRAGPGICLHGQAISNSIYAKMLKKIRRGNIKAIGISRLYRSVNRSIF